MINSKVSIIHRFHYTLHYKVTSGFYKGEKPSKKYTKWYPSFIHSNTAYKVPFITSLVQNDCGFWFYSKII